MSLQIMEPAQESLAQNVARRVRGLLAENRLTGSAVAAELGMTQQAFSRRTTGRVAFALDEVAALAEVLGVSEAYLLGFSETRNPRPATPDGGEGVRHQGLEPRTRWFTARFVPVRPEIAQVVPLRRSAAVVPLRPRRLEEVA